MLDVTLKDIKGQKENLALIQAAIQHNMPTLLVGHTGSGKTKMVYACANDAKRTVTRVNLTGQTGEDELAGKMGLANGATFFQEGPITKALREGHVLILDELNAANAEVLFLLHPLLDEGRFIRLMGKDGEIVKAHPEFRLFGTMNPPDYVGTKELNPAFLSRFQVILDIDYAKPSEEAKVIMGYFPALKEMAAIQMVEFATAVRKAHKAGEMLSIVSTRDLVSWAALTVTFNGDLKKAFEPVILNRNIQSRTDRERMKKEFLRITKEVETGLDGITEPLTLIAEAKKVRDEQLQKQAEIQEGIKVLERREKELAKVTVSKIDELNAALERHSVAVSTPPPPTNGHATTGTLTPQMARVRELLREGKDIQDIAKDPAVKLHFTTIYSKIRTITGKAFGDGGKELFIKADDAPAATTTVTGEAKRPQILAKVGDVSDGILAGLRDMTDAEIKEHGYVLVNGQYVQPKIKAGSDKGGLTMTVTGTTKLAGPKTALP